MLTDIGRADMATEIRAVNASFIMVITDNAPLHFFCHRFPHLVTENESRLIGQAQIAAHGDHALALHLIAENGNGSEVHAEWQLMIVEQRPASDRVVAFTGFAAEAERTGRAAAFIGIKATALGANRRTLSLRPTDLPEHGLGFRIRKPEDLRKC
jgi:hypothetical protein